jgi:hypothetical protein
MFENGSYLRRRKRFKTKENEPKKSDDDEDEKFVKPIRKTSFLIDNLLANDTSTNTSFASSPSSSETNNTLQQLFYTNDFDRIRQLTFHHQQLYW